MINFIYSIPIESLFFVGIITAVVALVREEKRTYVEIPIVDLAKYGIIYMFDKGDILKFTHSYGHSFKARLI